MSRLLWMRLMSALRHEKRNPPKGWATRADGKASIGELLGETAPAEDGTTKFVKSTTTTVKKWPIWAHFNPLDMLAHLLSEKAFNQASDQARYPGGLHWFNDESKSVKYSFHSDKYSSIYALNALNHLLFESEVLKIDNPDPEGAYPSFRDNIQMGRAALSSQFREVYNLLLRAHYEY